MPDYPDIRAGTQFGRTAARQWQNAWRDLSAVAGMQVGDGLEYVKVGEVMRLSLVPTTEQRQPKSRTVVLVEPFSRESMVLSVREVRYRDNPPTGPTNIRYTWHEDVFQAFPEPGTEPFEYEPFLWTERVDVGTPETPRLVLKEPQLSETVFLRARWENGLWILDLSGSIKPEKLAIAHAFGDEGNSGSQFLVIHEVVLKYDAEHVWTGGYETIGDPVEVNVWPNMTAGDYAPFLWEPIEIGAEATLLPLVFVLGIWRVKPQPKLRASLRRGPLRIVDCQPTELPATVTRALPGRATP